MSMTIVSLVQGTDSWHAHRAMHFNASDAPAMLGCSPFKTRADLLRERATGMAYEVDAATQRRFDDGHRFESLARPLAEEIIGESLYPVTGTNGDLSASFDGITMCHDVAFEHKTLSASLREAFAAIEAECGDGSLLPLHYRAQMEHQLAVSGAERVLFMASRWGDDGNLIESAYCWYYPDLDLRARIIAGWAQFAADVANYEPAVGDKPTTTGRAPETLPALNVQATGTVLASNLDQFREHAMAVLSGVNRDLQTDEDFADAEKTVKWCGDVEQRLAAAKANVLGQMESVDSVCRTIDEISAETRRIRLELDKLVKAEKESRKAEIVRAGVDAVREHYTTIGATLGDYAMALPASLQSDIGGSIKGLRSLQSIRDAVDDAVANAKIAASQNADRIRLSVEVLREHAGSAMHLFPDRITLALTKQPEDLCNLIAARIAEHERQQAAKLEAERERIRQEEAAKLEREQAESMRVAQMVSEAAKLPAMSTERVGEVLRGMAAAIAQPDEQPQFTSIAHGTSRKIKLGEINAAIAPLSISADGLSQLGFDPVAHDKAAKLYKADDLPMICRVLAQMLNRVAAEQKAA